jgi:NAD-dependent SIR2 family protein deacetylase
MMNDDHAQSEEWQAGARTAADWIAHADGLLIAAGAGMGVDSGLPDFRGVEGFWRAYPPLRHLGLHFDDIASPEAMRRMPRVFWGFYGHRLALYRRTVPHEGFHILGRWADGMAQGAFVFTSNVDGQFQKAGYDEERIMECHGSLHHLQCARHVWSAENFLPEVDMASCELLGDLPVCPCCGELARPNVLMFGDYDWIDARAEEQEARLRAWLSRVDRPVVIEMGAGVAIATVRRFSERLGLPVVRINPDNCGIAPSIGIGIPGGALAVLRAIDRACRGH